MAVKIQIRRDTSSNWSSVNPTLSSGEIGIETNTNKFKIGNGSSVWNDLNYSNALPSELNSASVSLYEAISSASATVNSNALNYANSASAHVDALAQGYASAAESNAEASALGYANSASAHVDALAQGYASAAESNAEASALGYANSASAHAVLISNEYTLSASSSLTSYINSKGIDKNNYVPTFSNDFSMGNGSYAAKYFESGDLNIAKLDIELGSTSLVGDGFSFTIPAIPSGGVFVSGQFKSGNYIKTLSQKSLSGSTIFIGFSKQVSTYLTFSQLFTGQTNDDVNNSYSSYDEIVSDQDRVFPLSSLLPRPKNNGDKIEISVSYEKSSV